MLHLRTRAPSTNLSGVHRILREVLHLLPDNIVNDRPGRLLTALCMLLDDDDEDDTDSCESTMSTDSEED
jgi:hypothetical protein